MRHVTIKSLDEHERYVERHANGKCPAKIRLVVIVMMCHLHTLRLTGGVPVVYITG
jgi:hypothetical protein